MVRKETKIVLYIYLTKEFIDWKISASKHLFAIHIGFEKSHPQVQHIENIKIRTIPTCLAIKDAFKA